MHWRRLFRSSLGWWCCAYWLMTSWVGVASAFSKTSPSLLHRQRGRQASLWLEPPKSQDQNDEDLRSRAARLRQEAQELESKLRASSSDTSTGKPALPSSTKAAPSPLYKDLKDSVWTFSYRFATEPDNDDDNDKPIPQKYGGKLTLLLREDGYTDVVRHEPAMPNEALEIPKAWGWDLETSAEDEKEYVLFSIDVVVPNGTKERCYFQARQETDATTGAIALKEGTVTVKQDVTETKDGSPTFWGFFSPKGILARFMYVGDFVARPARKDE